MVCTFWFISTHETSIPCGQYQVKEKTITAKRNGVKTIIFPSANMRDFDELATNVKEGLDVHFVDDYNQIFDIAFGDNPETRK